jgi:hypothetical protein
LQVNRIKALNKSVIDFILLQNEKRVSEDKNTEEINKLNHSNNKEAKDLKKEQK